MTGLNCYRGALIDVANRIAGDPRQFYTSKTTGMIIGLRPVSL
jgi:hypothetical protein